MEVPSLTGLDHDALRESAALYVLGALEDEERSTFEMHVKTCPECADEVRRLSLVTDALAYTAPAMEPPVALRARVLSSLHAESSASRPHVPWGWLAAAAMFVISISLGGYAISLRQRVRDLERQAADAVRATEAARVRFAVLAAPDFADVPLAGQAPAPRASGRAFWSQSRGLIFVASGLPQLPDGRTYQIWYLTNDKPVSAGLMKPDMDGQATAIFDSPDLAGGPSGFAVSLEPDGGVASPTGAIQLVGLRR